MKCLNGIVAEVKEKTKDSPIMLTYQNGNYTGKKEGAKRTLSVIDHKLRKKMKVTCDGETYEGDEEVQEHSRTFIVVLKAKTGDMQLEEVGRASLMHSAWLMDREVKAQGDDYAQRNSALQKTFGGKRGQRRIERSEKLQNNTNTNEEALLATVKEMKSGELVGSVSKLLDASMQNVLPPSHRDATTADTVYILSELVGEEVLNDIQDGAQDQLAHQTEFCSFAHALKSSQKVKPSPSVACAILFVDALVKFIKLKVIELKKAHFSDAPSIQKKILDTFTVRNGNQMTRSGQLRDKAMAYCIALGLLAGELSIPLDKLSQDINVSIKKLSPLCRAVGATLKEKGSCTYVLKLPLPSLPTLSAKKRTSI